MQTVRIKDRNDLIEFVGRISPHSIVSMEVETYEGSGLEGIRWEFLKYVYNKEKDTNRSPGWIEYTIVCKDPVSPEALFADYAELRKNGTPGSRSDVILCYDAE